MILIKQHNSQQVAHLYEHLFCMAVDGFFYEASLYPYLDYDISARVFPGGLIYADIALHTPDAKALKDKVTSISIALDDRSLNAATIQLMSELEQSLGVTGDKAPDFDAVRKELGVIDSSPWNDIDEVDLIDSRSIRLVAGSIYLTKEKKEMPARRVRVSFSLSQGFADAHLDLLPVFWLLARLMSANVLAALYSRDGFYGKGISHTPKGRTTRLIHDFNIVPHYPLDLKAVLATIEDALLDLHDTGAFTRLIADLHSISHGNSNHIFPDPEYMFNRTGLLLGTKGWNRIATDENCNLILSHMKVTVSTGRNRASVKVGQVLDIEQ